MGISKAEERAFPFPSNGKAEQKVEQDTIMILYQKTFPFPSNGKTYSDPFSKTFRIGPSPVFQFPSNGKVHCKTTALNLVGSLWKACFYSLLTGKRIPNSYQLSVWFFLLNIFLSVLFPKPMTTFAKRGRCLGYLLTDD